MITARASPALFREPMLQTLLPHASPSQLIRQRITALQRSRAPFRNFNSQNTSFWRPQTSQIWRNSLFRRRRNLRHNSTQSAAQEQSSPAKSQGVSAKFKELSRKYGWAAVGVYFGLSALDFPFCFLAVRLIGTERIGEAEHAIAHFFWSAVGAIVPSMRPEKKAKIEGAADVAVESSDDDTEGSSDDASIWTQLLLAYGVHKSLIFFRVPLTAAVTPRVVKTLRSWGWNIGPRSKAAAGASK